MRISLFRSRGFPGLSTTLLSQPLPPNRVSSKGSVSLVWPGASPGMSGGSVSLVWPGALLRMSGGSVSLGWPGALLGMSGGSVSLGGQVGCRALQAGKKRPPLS